MEKTEWPTKDKLEQLRASGLVPYSSISGRAFASAVLLLTCYGLCHSAAGLFTTYVQVFQITPVSLGAVSLGTWHSKWLSAADKVGQIFLYPALATLLAGLAWGLLQTKFFFRFSALGFNFERLSALNSETRASFFIELALRLLLSIVAMAVGIALASAWMRRVLELLNHDLNYLQEHLPKIAQEIVWLIGIILMLAAGLTWLFSWLRFMLAHRMTRKEVEDEVKQ